MKVESSQALDGRTILVTRPAHQANVLTQLIEQAGGRTLLFPAMAIEPPLDPQAAVALLHEIASFDFSIFVSANAVEQAFVLAPGLARGLRTVFAVGTATARALQTRGIADVIVPEDAADSEARSFAERNATGARGPTAIRAHCSRSGSRGTSMQSSR
jgi:uroporphyrinogen-III synthase